MDQKSDVFWPGESLRMPGTQSDRPGEKTTVPFLTAAPADADGTCRCCGRCPCNCKDG